MAYQQSDLDALDAAMLSGVKRVEFADGRKTEWHSLDEYRRFRADMKAEIAASRARSAPPLRTTIGRIVR